MRRLLAPVLLVSLLLLPVALMPIAAHAAQGASSEEVIWKAVNQQNVPQELLSGKLDAYIFGVPADVATRLAKNPNVVLYTAPTGYVDIGLNPAPVMIVEIPGNHEKDAAQVLGLPAEALEYVTYVPKDANLTLLNSSPWIGVKLNDTDVTVAELCAKPAHAIPQNVKVLWQSDKYDINPFCFKEVREALNYAIDRGYIVKNIYKGFAIPISALFSPADPIYPYIAEYMIKLEYPYDMAKAKAMVDSVMGKIGAVKKGGVWYYNGKPVKVIGYARVEDERAQIGDVVANALRQLGFQVDLRKTRFAEAISTVYFTDPKELKWHFYTEGWAGTGLDRWPGDLYSQYYAPYMGWLFGLWNPRWWNYRNPVADLYGTALFKMKATPDTIRQESYWDYLWLKEHGYNMTLVVKDARTFARLLGEAMTKTVPGSPRIWIAVVMAAQPASAKLGGVTLDLGTGLRNPYFYRTMFMPGSKTVTIGTRIVYSPRSIWEPFGGFQDIYSVDPAELTTDPWIWVHPFTGEPVPFRATYDVKTAGPGGKLPVPNDAVWFDPKQDKWVPARELGRVNATSVVTIYLDNIIGTHWHDNEPITMADIAAYLAEEIKIAYGEASLDPDTANFLRQVLSSIVAFEFLPGQKQLRIYINYWHFDPDMIAFYALAVTPNGFSPLNLVPVPATVTLALDYLAYVKKKVALGDSRAKSQNIPHINLVLPEDAKMVAEALDEIDFNMYKGYFTLPNGVQLMNLNEWAGRVAMAKAFIKQHHVAWISDGPFYIDSFNKDTQTIVFKRFDDPAYPLSYTASYYGIPPKVSISNVAPTLVVPSQPATVTATVEGPAPLHLKWILADTSNNVIASGEAQYSGGSFVVTIPAAVTQRLVAGATYKLVLVAYSERVAGAAEKTILLPTASVPAGKKAEEVHKKLEQEIALLNAKIARLPTKHDIDALNKKIAHAEKVANIALALSLIDLVLVAVLLRFIGIRLRR